MIPAIGMDDTEIAVTAHLPGSWPDGDGGDGNRGDGNPVVCIARRTRIPAEQIPTERARKRRTIPKDQLTLALDGRLDHVYGYSFILTNLAVGTHEQLAELEWWYRHRTDIEALNNDAKLGAALRHLPSADHAVNSVWMWAALLAARSPPGSRSSPAPTAATAAAGAPWPGCAALINVPARLTRRNGTLLLHLPPGPQLLATVLPRLQQLPQPG